MKFLSVGLSLYRIRVSEVMTSFERSDCTHHGFPTPYHYIAAAYIVRAPDSTGLLSALTAQSRDVHGNKSGEIIIITGLQLAKYVLGKSSHYAKGLLATIPELRLTYLSF